MTEHARRRNTTIALVVLIVAIMVLLLRCLGKSPPVPALVPGTNPAAPMAEKPPATGAPAVREPDEILTPAAVTAPERVAAGSAFSVGWKGPDNQGDYVTIVRSDAPSSTYGNYRQTKEGATLGLTAPMEPGAYEVRYISGRSHTILGRAAVEVTPVGAAVEAAAEVMLGAPFSVTWKGPNNAGDYITIVPKGTPDEMYGNYTNTDVGSPLTVTAPAASGEAELRYISGQGHQVLARRPIRVLAPEVTLSAPADAIAGTTITVTWTGPNNAGDYVTVVPAQTADGQYGNYTPTSTGSPLSLLMPIMAGNAELRYMTGQGARVLSRRAITIAAAEITLRAAPECAAGQAVSIAWTGPNNSGDYITVVSKATPDGQYGEYTVTSSGSPLSVNAPKEAGDAEVRYMSGQGGKVLARIPIRIVP